MALTKEQLKAREGKLTGSVVKVLMTGTALEIVTLWRQMLGMEQPPDLSGIWPIRLGEITEQLNLDWGERSLGPITRRGEVAINPEIPWAVATLDGWIEKRGCPIEAKHVGGREPLGTIIARYTPQCTWQMLVTGAKECALSVIMGANEPIVEIIPLDEPYASELMRRARAFMHHVENLTLPCELPKIEPPPLPIREYDMTPNEEWMQLADRWTQAYGAAQIANECETQIKKLVPIDAKTAYGHGIIVSRNRAGAMSLREMKNAK